MAGKLERRRVVVTGLVQGVGFRWRARKAAELYGVTGWVRNDREGSVSMELQGLPEQIDLLLQSLERGRYIRIEGLHAVRIPPEPEERDFRVLDDRW